MKTLIVFFLLYLTVISSKLIERRALQKSHEKSKEEKWKLNLLPKIKSNQTGSLTELINKIVIEYMMDCTPLVLYDKFTENDNNLLLENLFKITQTTYVHGQITDNFQIKMGKIMKNTGNCNHYILFIKDVMKCKDVIGPQSTNKVLVITGSSQWRTYEFLSSDASKAFINLLVISKSENVQRNGGEEHPYILYTHQLYIDALGSNRYQVLTSWRNGNFTRSLSLYPKKINKGFAGHRFIISLAHRPPFVIKKGINENNDIEWDGIDVRFVELLSKMFNFTTDYREAPNNEILGTSIAVIDMIKKEKANLGIGGIYITNEVIKNIEISSSYTKDCAAFITQTSTALPRYRAIMGPFHWSVWLAIIFIYAFAIIPLSFSHKHTLKHLMDKPKEIENMFWYVFGTFTNLFSFNGKNSWSHSNKSATRLFIGFYWIFSIIITSCYTGSIIAFVTLPIYPSTIDTVEQLNNGHYQIGTLNKDGWENWFLEQEDPKDQRLLRDLEFVPTIEEGIKNVTDAFFWPYAFLGSREQLDYIIRTSFTTLVVQAGFSKKLKNDVEWMIMRTATGQRLAANSVTRTISYNVEDRALTLADTQGMFLLLGAGFFIASVSLLSEWLGGCYRICKRKHSNSNNNDSSNNSLSSNYRTFTVPTPREKLDSIQYNNSIKLLEHSSSSIIENKIETSLEYNDSNQIIQTDCIVHRNINDDDDDNVQKQHKQIDYDAVIDDLYDFSDVFGEKNIHDDGNLEK